MINFSAAVATCHDCKKPVATGPLILEVEAMVMGGLPVVLDAENY